MIYNVNGKLSDKLFEQMLHDFELELDGLNTSITQDQQELDRISSESVNAEKFIALVKRYTDFSELTPAMINEFIEKILVHQAEGKGASRTQEIEIFFNFVGKVEIPHEEVELTEEEIAAIAEQERRRAKKAEYNRRYMQKKRKQWKEQQEQAQEPQEPIELPLVQDKKGASEKTSRKQERRINPLGTKGALIHPYGRVRSAEGLSPHREISPRSDMAALPQQGAAPLAPLRGYPCTPTKTVHPPLASVPFLRVLLSYPGGDTHSHLPLEHRHCKPRKRQISRCRSRLPKR